MNFAARTNAGLWLDRNSSFAEVEQAAAKKLESACEASNTHEEPILGEEVHLKSEEEILNQPLDEDGGAENELRHIKKQRKLPEATGLVEVEIDWENEQQPAKQELSDSIESQLPSSFHVRETPKSQIALPKLKLPPLTAKPQTLHSVKSEGAALDREVEVPAAEESNPSGEISGGEGVSAEGLEDYSPSRHGGESPPPRSALNPLPEVSKDGSIAIFAPENAVSYGAYILEEASHHNFGCDHEYPFVF